MDDLTQERFGPGIPYREAYARPVSLRKVAAVRSRTIRPERDSVEVITSRRRELDMALNGKGIVVVGGAVARELAEPSTSDGTVAA